ncbi:MAG: cytochrome c [Acidobacteriota bacterium]|nr:cytochrome c [Acidobacteriota bacterium]
MRLTAIFVIVSAFSLVGLMAQDDLAQFQPLMKAAAGGQRAAMQAVQGGDAAAAKAGAKDAAENLDKIAAFFKAKGKDDAVKFAEEARDAAKAASEAGSVEDIQANLRKMGPNCQGCHAQYRMGNAFKNL